MRCISSTPIEDHVYVGMLAAWPYKTLSQYSTSSPFVVRDIVEMQQSSWCSVSAAYECLSRVSPEEWAKFEVRGFFGRMRNGAAYVTSSHALAGRLIKKYGEDRDNGKPGMDGYLSRMVLQKNPPLVKLRSKHDRINALEDKVKALVTITVARMEMDVHARGVLLSTGDRMLVDLNRFAEADVKKGLPERALWGGYVSTTNGRLYGCNLMGDVLMQARKIIREELGVAGATVPVLTGVGRKRKCC